MPEEDDDALGEMLGERLKDSAAPGAADDSDGDGQERSDDSARGTGTSRSGGNAADSARAERSTGSARSPESEGPTQPTESTQSTEATRPTPDEGGPSDEETSAAEDTAVGDTSARDDRGPVADSSAEDGKQDAADTARSRPPFPLYITPGLKATVQDRFEKFNAERTLDDEPQVEKHKHFMEGLLRAGLDHPDLEAYVLEEYEDR